MQQLTINVSDHGVKPDSDAVATSDALQNILNMAPEGSRIVFPTAHYNLKSAKTNKSFDIDFQYSTITASPDPLGSTSVIQFESDLGVAYPIQTAATYVAQISLESEGDALNFYSGDWIVIRDRKVVRGWDQDLGGTKSGSYDERLEVNRVSSVSGGTIILEKPIEWLYSGPDSATVRKIINPVTNASIRNVKKIQEIDPGSPRVGSTVVGPHLFSFFYCISPVTKNIHAEGWQLHVIQFSKCVAYYAGNVTGRNPFRPELGGHGYVVQSERSIGGVVDRASGWRTRHLVDHTQDYDCVSKNCKAYSPRVAQFACHGQGSKRIKSIDDTVYFTGSSANAVGWSMGNPAFNADYGFTIVRPIAYASGGISCVVTYANSEDLLVIDPLFVVTKQTSGAFIAVDITSGAKNTKLRGGMIDLSNATGSPSDRCVRTFEKTSGSDTVGIAPVNLSITDLDIKTPLASGSFGISAANLTGSLKVKGMNIVGSSSVSNGFDVAATTSLRVFEFEGNTFDGVFQRGLRTLAVPSQVYRVLNNRYLGNYTNDAKLLQASPLLVQGYDDTPFLAYPVSQLPAGRAGMFAYAANGRKAGELAGAGTGVPVFHDGTAWKAFDTGATVSS